MSHDFAMIVRADHGGIAAQTWAIATHCQPRRVLVIDLGPGGRGRSDPTLYDFVPERRVALGYPSAEEAEWLATGGLPVFSVEGLYGSRTQAALAHLGNRVVLQANPELFVPSDLAGLDLHVVAPTDWRLDVLPAGTEVLPVPVDTEALAPLPREPGPLRLGHMCGSAMLDRNGTLSVLAALRRLEGLDAEVLIANRPLTRLRRDRRIRAWREARSYLERWDAPRPDLLVQPRRYGGLCLPAQEAAACGVPCLMTDVAPQTGWPVPRVETLPGREFDMKGGSFWVCEASVPALTGTLRELAEDPARLRAWSDDARAWAETLSWGRWRDRYLDVLAR